MEGTGPELDGVASSGLMAGKVAFVTGAARGLGHAIVKQLAGAGASGVAFDMLPKGEANKLPERWTFLQGNVCQEEDVRDAIATTIGQFGKLDAVVANAGVTAPWVPTQEINLEDWRRTFAVNVEGTLITIKHAARRMKTSGGSIVALGSLNSWKGHPQQAAYVASKHAVLGLVRSTALDLGKQGIRVNALAPGPVMTEALLERIRNRSRKGGPGRDEALREMANATALGHTVSESDVATTCLFLLSSHSNGVTGQLIPVDAGLI